MVSEATPSKLIAMMVGRTVDTILSPRSPVPLGETVFSVSGLSHPTEFADISFDLRKGEILGFYGLVGAGRTELMQALFGVTPRTEARGCSPSSPSPRRPLPTSAQFHHPRPAPVRRRRRRHRLDSRPEERQRQGRHSPRCRIFENITLPPSSSAPAATASSIWPARSSSVARVYAQRLDLRAASLSQDVGTLSGGNQQKVVIGKWLATTPRVIILDEPTKGIDVGSKAAVHAFMGELVGQQGLGRNHHEMLLRASGGHGHVRPRHRLLREGRMVGTLRPRRPDRRDPWSLPPPPATSPAEAA